MNINDKIIIERIKKYDFDFYKLSDNPNISFEVILNSLDKKWDWGLLSKHPKLTFDFILNHLDYNWSWVHISIHSNITFENIIEHLELNWIWEYVCYNENITIKNIIDNPNLPWSWRSLSKNDNITQYFLTYSNLSWNFDDLTYNGDLTDIDIILEKNNLLDQLKFIKLDENPNITINYIKECINNNNKSVDYWCWEQLSCNMSIKDIIDNPDLPWDMSIVCEFNKYLTINDIIKYPNYLNCWSSLSCHANITFNDILPYQNLPWQYDYFSDRVDYKTAIEHDDKPWRWEVIIKNNELEELSIMKDKLLILFNSNYNRKSCTFISCNKTIKLDDIKNYKLDWDYDDLATYIKNISFNDINDNIIKNNLKNKDYWKYISKNQNIFKINSTDYDYIEYVNKYLAGKRIWWYWFRCITNPDYLICRNRLIKEFNSSYLDYVKINI